MNKISSTENSSLYDAGHIETFYDAYEKEWDRLSSTPAERVSFHVHRHYLETFVKEGDRVLEAGAGPGRFTIKLARLGAQVVVGDISKRQLELNEQHVQEAGCEAAVESRVQLDITDLRAFETNSFDAVVCYGGALSYVLERADDAVAELLRVVKPGGHVLLSVMSLLGTTRAAFEKITTLDAYPEIVNQVNGDGVLTSDSSHFPHKLYRFSELKALFEKYPCHLVTASAANYLSLGRDAFLETHLQSPELRQQFLAWELDYCVEEGAVDGGTHIIVVVQKDRT